MEGTLAHVATCLQHEARQGLNDDGCGCVAVYHRLNNPHALPPPPVPKGCLFLLLVTDERLADDRSPVKAVRPASARSATYRAWLC